MISTFTHNHQTNAGNSPRFPLCLFFYASDLGSSVLGSSDLGSSDFTLSESMALAASSALSAPSAESPPCSSLSISAWCSINFALYSWAVSAEPNRIAKVCK
jgi:hypothetical protein